jgi:hypothetical protein
MGRYLELAKKACETQGAARQPVTEPMMGLDELPDGWRVWFEERAAIMEYDGGLPREQAESAAMAETIRLMRAEKKD